MMRNTKTSLLFAAALGCSAAAACTSFTIHRTKSETGRMLVQKCRDSTMGRLDAGMMTAPDGRRWMRIGASGGAMFAMNDRGVAVTVNTGNKLEGDKIPKKALTHSVPLFNAVMEKCATAESGVKLIEKHFRNPAGIYMIADANRAFLVESGAGYGEHKELTGGMFVIANEMHLPGVEEFNTSTAGSMGRQRAREANTRAALKRTRNEQGKYTRRGMFATSRILHGSTIRTQNVFRRISPKSGVGSVSAVCFEPDAEFPEHLSTAYIALGPQRHTVYLPCPMALAQFPEAMRNGRWAELAVTIRKNQGEKNPLLPKIVELEDRLLTEYDLAREEARQLLRSGRTVEAEKLLNDRFAAHYRMAEKLLTELAREAPAAKIGK
ncbi:MAG: hypothetical protein J6Y54_08745 [Lentisphaeria bacterium]|nr:hypothetical protein [Lentisphaeria bacterium]